MNRLIATVLLTLVGCTTDIQSGIESATELLYQEEYVAAERLYRKLLKRLGEEEPLTDREEQDRLHVLDRLGKINAMYLHDYPKAIAYYQRLVQLYPESEEAYLARATVADIYHHKLGKHEEAIDEYEKLVDAHPEKPDTARAQLQVVNAYFQLRDYDKARAEAEALVEHWPNNAEAIQARFQIANSYYVQSRYTEAVAVYEDLLSRDHDAQLRSLVLFELGNCYQELGDPERALQHFYSSLGDHPNPLLVQRKIKRVRKRLHKLKPSADIHSIVRATTKTSTKSSSSSAAASKSKPAKPKNAAKPPKPSASESPETATAEDEAGVADAEPTVATTADTPPDAKTTSKEATSPKADPAPRAPTPAPEPAASPAPEPKPAPASPVGGD